MEKASAGAAPARRDVGTFKSTARRCPTNCSTRHARPCRVFVMTCVETHDAWTAPDRLPAQPYPQAGTELLCTPCVSVQSLRFAVPISLVARMRMPDMGQHLSKFDRIRRMCLEEAEPCFGGGKLDNHIHLSSTTL